ncbi:MAG TPA: M50 family metallopeptidase [Candidatus Kapabacteria bacterium]|nr:M50 family metallopeptidase [Candidatus Kapabacteria bacterium]
MAQSSAARKELSITANILILSAVFIISVLLWDTLWLYPVKLFVVALHEMSHGLAAILMGGKIDHIQIDSRIGGYCCYALPMGAGFLQQSIVAAAGYLGSMLWGAFIFIVASRTRFDRGITFFVALVMLVISFYVIKTGQLFGIIFCLVFTLFLFVTIRWFPPLFHKIFLKSLGLISCLYAIIDIKEDIIDRSGIGSDADRIAQLLGIPRLSIAIGISWIVLALLILVFTLKVSFKKPVK